MSTPHLYYKNNVWELMGSMAKKEGLLQSISQGRKKSTMDRTMDWAPLGIGVHLHGSFLLCCEKPASPCCSAWYDALELFGNAVWGYCLEIRALSHTITGQYCISQNFSPLTLRTCTASKLCRLSINYVPLLFSGKKESNSIFRTCFHSAGLSYLLKLILSQTMPA